MRNSTTQMFLQKPHTAEKVSGNTWLHFIGLVQFDVNVGLFKDFYRMTSEFYVVKI